MNTVSNISPTETTVIVRYDPTQSDHCVIAYSRERGATTVTFGPVKPPSTYRDETLVINALRAEVAPEGVL